MYIRRTKIAVGTTVIAIRRHITRRIIIRIRSITTRSTRTIIHPIRMPMLRLVQRAPMQAVVGGAATTRIGAGKVIE